MLGEDPDVLGPGVAGKVDERVDGEVDWDISSVDSLSADMTDSGGFPSNRCGRATASTLVPGLADCVSDSCWFPISSDTASTSSMARA